MRCAARSPLPTKQLIENARLLDRRLQAVTRRDSLCRRVLGRLARALLRWRAHHELGFARLGDYTSERLGLSPREVQTLARVEDRLRRLPSIAAAFEAGELSWTHVRLLVEKATPEDEADWVVLARGRGVQVLEALVGRAKPPSDDGEIDGEPAVMVRVPCPRRIRAAWHEVRELAERMAGSRLAPWQVAESVAAEGLSARGAEPNEAPPIPTAAAPRRRPSLLGRPSGPDWSPVGGTIADDVARLADGAERLDAFALDARLRAVVAVMQRNDGEVGALLATFFGSGFHRLLGFDSHEHYVRERLGMSGRRARALVALERSGRETPDVLNAYREGRLSWLRALAVLSVAHGEVGARWVARAEEVTLKRLVQEVEWARTVRDVSAPDVPVAPPAPDADLEWQIRARVESDVADVSVAFFAPFTIATLFALAVGAFTEPGEPSWRGFERVLEHVRATWSAQPRHRDPVFERDGWRCAVPACSSRRNLQDHHVVFRSRGGGNGRDNRIAICAWHHLRGIHGGRVRAAGTAPHDITWRLGVRGRRCLIELRGERYVRTGS